MEALTTDRLLLSPPTAADVPDIVLQANDRRIAQHTSSLPNPYAEADAIFWINMANNGRKTGKARVFAIREQGAKTVCGGIGLHLDPANNQAEIGYWLGVAHWNKGYVTEAARAILTYGFEELSLRRIFAHHMILNPASGRVLQKIGMKQEGLLRQHIVRYEKIHDVAIYGLLQEEF